MKTGKELTLDWFERVWNNREEGAIEELMCAHCDVKGLNLAEKGAGGFAQFHKAYCSAFNNIKIEPLEMVEEEGMVAGHARFLAHHRESGKDVEILFSFSAKWVDGKIVEARNVVDFTTLLAQIEALDPRVLSEAIPL